MGKILKLGHYYECGCCGEYHHEDDNWQDCRDDATRFHIGELVDLNTCEDLPGITTMNIED